MISLVEFRLKITVFIRFRALQSYDKVFYNWRYLMNSFTKENKQKAKNGYNQIAWLYDPVAKFFFMNRINKSQTALIPCLSDFTSCLILGGGSGYFLQKLLTHTKNGHITYVDLSDNMIDRTRRRIQKYLPEALVRITFVCASIADIKNEPYDLIVCNYFLDVFSEDEVNDILDRFYTTLLASNGYIYITDFAIPESDWLLRKISLLILRMLYFIFRIMTFIRSNQLPDFNKLFQKNNFVSLHSRKFLGGMMVSSIYKKRHPLIY